MVGIIHRVRSRWTIARLTPWLGALSVVTTLAVFAVSVLTLEEMHDDAWRRAEQSAQNILHLVKQDAARNLELLDLSLEAVIVGLAMPEIGHLAPDLRHAVLFDRGATAKYLGAIRALDETGRVLAESREGASTTAEYVERDYFRHHRSVNDGRLFVSAPFKSGRTGELSISLSRRLSRPDGAFGGVVTATMRLAYFRELFSRLELGPRDAVNLFRMDGTVLMRLPFREAEIGRRIPGAASAPFAYAASGAYTARSVIDHNVERLYTFTHVGEYPLIVNVAMSVDDIFAAWARKAMVIGPVVAALCLVTILLTALLQRELRRRTEAEASVIAANTELSRLAVTDPLTGLANRRLFDAMLDREWRRCGRTGCSVSLLMIDADNFKSYNDVYGHQAGDRVLQAIASRLVGAIRPLQDLVCRVGGEEFAVLMPETGEARALQTAEAVRHSIEGAAIPHRGGSGGRVTISVGVAHARPANGGSIPVFVESADRALYDSKASGRNQVRSAHAAPLSRSDGTRDARAA